MYRELMIWVKPRVAHNNNTAFNSNENYYSIISMNDYALRDFGWKVVYAYGINEEGIASNYRIAENAIAWNSIEERRIANNALNISCCCCCCICNQCNQKVNSPSPSSAISMESERIKQQLTFLFAFTFPWILNKMTLQNFVFNYEKFTLAFIVTTPTTPTSVCLPLWFAKEMKLSEMLCITNDNFKQLFGSGGGYLGALNVIRLALSDFKKYSKKPLKTWMWLVTIAPSIIITC
uniref:Uncharacterized protein n=1 Tax=Glossina brevipalpis TaxID=37001 RepID=A0A1A9WNR7_9MUSC